MTAPLEPYLQKAFSECGDCISELAFHPPSGCPVLSRDRANHILLYPGAFTPPHVGHLRLLQHVLNHHGNELNVVAAMVFPRPDYYLERKNKGSNETFVTQQKDRCVLWEEDARFPANAFVWRECEMNEVDFSRNLIEIAAHDGFKVEFVLLHATELLDTDRRTSTWSGLCQQAIVSDFGRPSEHFSASSIAPILGYGPWKYISYEEELEGLRLRSGQLIHPQYSTVSRVWRCDCVWDARRRLYFVASTRSSSSSGPEEAVSSTRIRQLLQHERGTALVFALKEIALSSELLLEKIANDSIWMDKEQRESINDSMNLRRKGDGEERGG
jgi:hypothetical protein